MNFPKANTYPMTRPLPNKNILLNINGFVHKAASINTDRCGVCVVLTNSKVDNKIELDSNYKFTWVYDND